MRYEHQLQENQKLAVIRVHMSTVALMERAHMEVWRITTKRQA